MAETANQDMKKALQEVDDRIAELNKNIELGKAIEALHENEDFQRVILSGYLDDEAQRLFGVLVEPSTLKRDVMENIQDKLASIRNLKQYFGTSLQNAHMAPEQIAEEETYRKTVTAHYANVDGDEPDAVIE